MNTDITAQALPMDGSPQEDVLKPISILLVEDDPIHRRALLRQLKREGPQYVVATARDCAEARTMLRDIRFDIILLDYHLPDGSGLDLFREVRETPVIFVTGNGNERVAVQAMKEGAYDYVIKDIEGFYLELLAQNINSVLQRRRDEEERNRLIEELKRADATIHQLRGLIPICSWCKRIRNDHGYWEQIEIYLAEHADAEFTHGVCPHCYRKLDKQLHSRDKK